METNEKAFMTQQLICMLPSLCVKVLGYLLNWQKYPVIKYYENQMTKFMHISKEELEVAIQTLSDRHLIDISKIDGQWAIQLDKKTIMSYINVPMQKVHDTEGFKLADRITWNVEEKKDDSRFSDEFFKKKFDQVTDQELECLVKELQRRREEKKKGCQVVYPSGLSEEELLAQLPF